MIYYSYDKAGEFWVDCFYTDERSEDLKSKSIQKELDKYISELVEVNI